MAILTILFPRCFVVEFYRVDQKLFTTYPFRIRLSP